MLGKITKLAGVAAALAMAASASAGTVIATFNSVSPSVNVNYVSPVGSGSTTAGVFNWTRTGGTHVGSPAGNFSSFCIELNQNVAFSSSYTFNIQALKDSPSPGLPVPGPLGMGATKASDLKKLWAAYRNSIVDNTTAAAFQVAVWEIVYEASTNYSVSNGNGAFYLTNQAAVRNQANAWLSSLGSLTAEANLAAMSSPSVQDQLVLVPTPPAVLAGAGLMGAVAVKQIRRRLAKPAI